MGFLVKVFKKTSFKDWQLRVISATLGGKDTLVVQPTGSGKSLHVFPVSVCGYWECHHCFDAHHQPSSSLTK